jgi:hypothetical protein
MTDILNLIQDEPNLHFSNFTNYYTMEDKKGGNTPKTSLNDLKKEGNLHLLTTLDTSKLKGGRKVMTSSCGDTPPQ